MKTIFLLMSTLLVVAQGTPSYFRSYGGMGLVGSQGGYFGMAPGFIQGGYGSNMYSNFGTMGYLGGDEYPYLGYPGSIGGFNGPSVGILGGYSNIIGTGRGYYNRGYAGPIGMIGGYGRMSGFRRLGGGFYGPSLGITSGYGRVIGGGYYGPNMGYGQPGFGSRIYRGYGSEYDDSNYGLYMGGMMGGTYGGATYAGSRGLKAYI